MFDKFNSCECDVKIVLNNGEKEFTFRELKELVFIKSEFLKSIDSKNIVVLGNDSFSFVINFLACVFARKEIFLLDDKHNLNYLETDYYVAEEVSGNEKQTGDLFFGDIDSHNTIINFFTSGSSAQPKQIKKTLWNLIEEAKDIAEEFENFGTNKLNFISTTKMNHLFGLTFHFMVPFCNGYTICTKPVQYPEEINTPNAFLVSTPAFLEKLMKYNVELETPPEWIISAGSKLNIDIFKYIEKNSNVIEIYGGTETGIVAYKRHYNETAMKKFKKVKISTDEQNRAVVVSNYFPEDIITQNDAIEIISGDYFKLLERTDRVLKIHDKRISAPRFEKEINDHKFIGDSYCLRMDKKLACLAVLSSAGKDYFLKNGNISLTKELKMDLSQKFDIVPQKWRYVAEIPKNETGKFDKQRIEKIFNTNITYPALLNHTLSKDEANIEMVFPKNSNFFRGHFDEFPITPGVVQLFFAHWLAQDYFNIKIPVDTVRKIKFTNIIKPDRRLHLSLINKEDRVAFKYFFDDTIFSSGIFSKVQAEKNNANI